MLIVVLSESQWRKSAGDKQQQRETSWFVIPLNHSRSSEIFSESACSLFG
jgi:hypothetical protein